MVKESTSSRGNQGGAKRFVLINATKEAEDKTDLIAMRRATIERPTGTVATTMHLVKSALGSGILSGHVAYKKAGYLVALIANALVGVYITLSLRTLTDCAQILCKRTNQPFLSYPDCAECALTLCKNKKLRKLAKVWRYCVDGAIALELFGACATYELVVAKTIKQLVEDQQTATIHPSIPGTCIIVTIYYSMKENPGFENLIPAKDVAGFFSFAGMVVFSMSCASQLMTIENNMANPYHCKMAVSIAMVFITLAMIMTSFFGYNAYLEDCDAPITVNFPMELWPKLLKVCIAIMIVVTHALNFFVPFTNVWVYIKRKIKPENQNKWEYFYRALFVIIIGLLAAVFPSINLLMGFLGCFCLSNVAFIWPQCLEMLIYWERDGFGFLKWRLWKCLFFSAIGFVILIAGTIVHAADLPELFR